jgi:hypothetical protein
VVGDELSFRVFFVFFVLGFELTYSCLLDRCSTRHSYHFSHSASPRDADMSILLENLYVQWAELSMALRLRRTLG